MKKGVKVALIATSPITVPVVSTLALAGGILVGASAVVTAPIWGPLVMTGVFRLKKAKEEYLKERGPATLGPVETPQDAN